MMARLLAGLAPQAERQADFWSRLLGTERLAEEGGELSLTWQNMPEAWIFWLVILPAVFAGVWLIYRKERRDIHPAARALLIGLRGALILMVLLMLMGPVLTVTIERGRRGYVIVLVDDSRSMRKADALQTREEKERIGRVSGLIDDDSVISDAEDAALAKLTRADLVRRVLTNPELRVLEKLEEKLNVAYFTFSNGAAPRASREKLLEAYSADNCLGSETAIGDAIKSALSSLKGQRVVGVVVISDGKNNSGMATAEIAKQLKQRYLPIYTIAAGIPHTPKDIALLELQAREAVLANDELEINYKVRSYGYVDKRVQVGLYVYAITDENRDPGTSPEELEKILEESRHEMDQDVALEGASKKQKESFIYRPRTPGDYLLILKIPPSPDENTAHNNYLTHRLRVADDKIKVLYVEHPPRYEYRFLKNALVRDPKILVHCLLTSADEGFVQEHTKGSDDPLFERPLREFPRELKDLLQFDVIIYGDVEPSRLGPKAAAHIQSFVTEFGGGLIFISGMMYNPAALRETPLSSLLPVVPEVQRDLFAHEKVYTESYRYQLTPDGRESPITDFKEFKGDKARNAEHWEDRDRRDDGLIPIRWFQPIRKLKAGATPLVEVADVPGLAARPPLFVTQHVGRGRVFWSGTDETWLWRYLVGDYPWFYPFWQQAMYWVREGKLLGARRFRVTVDKDRYSRGEPVQIFANAYNERYEPREDPEIEIFVDPPSGGRQKVRLLKDQARNGYYEGVYRPRDTGLYRAWAGGEDETSRTSAKFTVFIPDREEDEPILDIVTLQELAAQSNGGLFFPIDRIGELHDREHGIQKSVLIDREELEDDLWDSPLVFLVFALLITTEWIVRKVCRML